MCALASGSSRHPSPFRIGTHSHSRHAEGAVQRAAFHQKGCLSAEACAAPEPIGALPRVNNRASHTMSLRNLMWRTKDGRVVNPDTGPTPPGYNQVLRQRARIGLSVASCSLLVGSPRLALLGAVGAAWCLQRGTKFSWKNIKWWCLTWLVVDHRRGQSPVAATPRRRRGDANCRRGPFVAASRGPSDKERRTDRRGWQRRRGVDASWGRLSTRR